MNTTYFLNPDDAMPDASPEVRGLGRRGVMVALVLSAAALTGAVLASHPDMGVPAQKPGPRRYPPAYWGFAAHGRQN